MAQDPSYPVNRMATIPATRVLQDGTVIGDNWPLNTSQTAQGRTAEGFTLTLSSLSSQASATAAPVVTKTGIAVDLDGDGRSDRVLEISGNGSVTLDGRASAMTREQGLNLAQYIDALTDHDHVNATDMNRVLDQFRSSLGIERR